MKTSAFFRHTVSTWNRFWLRASPPHTIALFRIVFGLFLLFYWGLKLPHVPLIYSRDAIVLPLIQLGSVFVPPSAGVAWLLFGVFYTSLLLFTVGAFTRLSAWVAVLFYAYYWCLSLYLLGSSFDRLFLFSLLVLACSGCGATFSFDAWRRWGSVFAWRPVSILPQRLIAAQVTATYLGVGWQKLWLPAWRGGEVLSYGFVGAWATPLGRWVARLSLPLWMYDWMVNAVKAFEITLPFGLWSRYRWWFFAGGVIFHTGISITLGIWWFQAMIPMYILFVEPEEVFAFLRRHFPRQIPSEAAKKGREPH